MDVLVVGSGAREHALVRVLHRDPEVGTVHSAPGNPGMAALGPVHAVDQNDPVAVADLAGRLGVDLVVVGPEAPLVAGVTDAVRAAGIPCFGPSAAAARIEGSKAFANEVMAAAGVPTAASVTCESIADVERALERFGPPYVVKGDGLAAGKGVVVSSDVDAALAHATANLDAGVPVVVEEFLDGPEVSVFVITDGAALVPLQPAQDFKRLGDGDAGPNTGGMGAYTPLPWAPADLVQQVVDTVARPTLDELRRRGTPFVGVLYCGLALTKDGIRVVEFNARFGDPEAQVLLDRLESSPSRLLFAASTGQLDEALLDGDGPTWSDGAAVTVVMAAAGYPDAPRKGDPIDGVKAAEQVEGAYVLQAGTGRDAAGGLVTAGGRTLSVTASGPDLPTARARAYRAVERISIPGGLYRTDIAATAAAGDLA